MPRGTWFDITIKSLFCQHKNAVGMTACGWEEIEACLAGGLAIGRIGRFGFLRNLDGTIAECEKDRDGNHECK